MKVQAYYFLLVTEACGFAGREDERSCKTKSKRGEKQTRIGGEHWLYMPHKCVLWKLSLLICCYSYSFNTEYLVHL
jgi:hypothetical protein